MGNPIIQIIFLAGVAIVLILKLRSLLGTREGFESDQPVQRTSRTVSETTVKRRDDDFAEVISNYVRRDSPTAKALLAMKEADGSFSIEEFIEGAKKAYEMILVAYAEGKLDNVKAFLSTDVHDSFDTALRERRDANCVYSAQFIGVESCRLKEAVFDDDLKDAEITMEFVGELISYGTDKSGEIVEGNDRVVRKQRDVWTFARNFEMTDPNWTLEATAS